MEPGSAPDKGRLQAGPSHAGRRRLAARDASPPSGDLPWEDLSALGPDPIRITPANTSVWMSVRWLGGLIVRGEFRDVHGTIHVPAGAGGSAAVTVEVGADSVRTGISLRDRHLRGPLFLDVARHPLITFRGGDVMRWPTHISVPGSLTVRGVTRTEELRCTLDGLAARRELLASMTLSRRAYGVGVPKGLRRLDPLFVVIGDEVRISIRITV